MVQCDFMDCEREAIFKLTIFEFDNTKTNMELSLCGKHCEESLKNEDNQSCEVEEL